MIVFRRGSDYKESTSRFHMIKLGIIIYGSAVGFSQFLAKKAGQHLDFIAMHMNMDDRLWPCGHAQQPNQ
ncbi:hypothetical protein ACJX0J_029645, partial [Zea mays]